MRFAVSQGGRNMQYDLTGRNVLLTGASRGLGLQIAQTLWQCGANLFLVARSGPPLQSLCSDLTAQGRSRQIARTTTADLALPHAASGIVEAALRACGRIDVLINNAAILGPIGPLWQSEPEAWEQTIRVNLLAPVALCRAVLPGMIERRCGKIINLSGGGATGPRPFFSAYGAAKAALVRFTETLAHETCDYNIQVNAVAPGAMATDMHAAVLVAGPGRAGAAEYAQAVHQAESGGTNPARPATLCAFLASSASDAISGRLLSAIWDPWEALPARAAELAASDIYTLRRVVPADRGKEWA